MARKTTSGFLVAQSTKTSDLKPAYETTVVTKVDTTEDELKALKDKIADVVTNFAGEMIYHEDWGRRKLAYPIQNETRANYNFFVLTGEPGLVAELERNFRNNEKVIRFLSVQVSKEFEKDQFFKDLGAGSLLKMDRPETTVTPVTPVQA